jgi:hypothetical protein
MSWRQPFNKMPALRLKCKIIFRTRSICRGFCLQKLIIWLISYGWNKWVRYKDQRHTIVSMILSPMYEYHPKLLTMLESKCLRVPSAILHWKSYFIGVLSSQRWGSQLIVSLIAFHLAPPIILLYKNPTLSALFLIINGKKFFLKIQIKSPQWRIFSLI